MCLSSLTSISLSPSIIHLPTTFAESFPSHQASRGSTTWKTLFSSKLSAGIALCPPLGYLGLHRHPQPELYYVISGEGIVEIEGENYHLEKGMTVFIPGDAEHGVRNEGAEDFKWLYVFRGQFEDVEYRFRAEGAYGTKSEKDVKAKL
jgi:mannose-6-phosphate isomerase-like protein (cupin superfamily)